MLTELIQPQRQLALERFRQLRAHFERDAPLAQIAAEATVSPRTAQRWVRRYRDCGLAGLVRTSHTDRGRRRRLHNDLRQLTEGLALRRPPLGPTAIHRELCRVAEAHGQRPQRFSTVYSVVSALPGVPEITRGDPSPPAQRRTRKGDRPRRSVSAAATRKPTIFTCTTTVSARSGIAAASRVQRQCRRPSASAGHQPSASAGSSGAITLVSSAPTRAMRLIQTPSARRSSSQGAASLGRRTALTSHAARHRGGSA